MVDMVLGRAQGDNILPILIGLDQCGRWHQEEARVVGDVTVDLFGVPYVVAEHCPSDRHDTSNTHNPIIASLPN
jgi:hypothetical protein